MSDEESFTPASRLNSDSATSPTCAARATTNPTVTSCHSSSRKATRSSTSGPYASAATSPPTRPPTAPAQVFRGDSTGASFGPPTSVPAAIAHVSHTQHRQHAGERPPAQPQQQQRHGDGGDGERDAHQQIAGHHTGTFPKRRSRRW